MSKFIRETYYLEWIANVVMVPKPNGTWRMCVDYTDLNKACPKESFPLPKIDRLVDSTTGNALLSFIIIGFRGGVIHPMGTVTLPVRVGDKEAS